MHNPLLSMYLYIGKLMYLSTNKLVFSYWLEEKTNIVQIAIYLKRIFQISSTKFIQYTVFMFIQISKKPDGQTVGRHTYSSISC